MRITCAAVAAKYLRPRFRTDIEEIWAISLNADKVIVASQCLFRGTVDHCLFHPRDLFRFGCQANASTLIVAHNHPSGAPDPSDQDMVITRQILWAAEIIQIPVVDHIILAGKKYYSFAESGMLRKLEMIKSPAFRGGP
jgi:DNA repair protein RadC